jgi:hypothetical protein
MRLLLSFMLIGFPIGAAQADGNPDRMAGSVAPASAGEDKTQARARSHGFLCAGELYLRIDAFR